MNNKQWDSIWINGRIATMETGLIPYGLRENAAMGVKNGNIIWLGAMSDLPASPEQLAACVYDLKEYGLVTPGLIDCHTHLVYAGNRCQEFEWRLQGKSYQEIAHAGGGIRSTMRATRNASAKHLLEVSLKRARALLIEGVTTIEIKSGYGLDVENEIKMLRVAQQIAKKLPVTIATTFLGAHALPPEFEGRAEEYIDFICVEMIPLIAKHKLATAVDVFCETIGFSLAQTERVFEAATRQGLAVKCHAEQLSLSESVTLAANYQALSVDHLEYLSEKSIIALAGSRTVAVLLPGAFYFLQEKQSPPIKLLRQYAIPIAIATDSNPGTAPITSLRLMLNMACTLFKLTPEEALKGVTLYAAQALGLEKTHGTLQIGKVADFVMWDVEHPAELSYWIGNSLCQQVIKAGKLVWIN